MSEQWYYAWSGEKLGPFSGEQLKELAEAGKIQPTDTIWKDGVDQGVEAGRVKNLFAPEPATSPESTATSETTTASLLPPLEIEVEHAPSPKRKPDSATGLETLAGEDRTERKPAAKPGPSETDQPKPKKGHAMAIRGAV